MADIRFQVFVSSTYTDLIEERRQVTEQLLRLRCIPSGMELFTAGGRPPWEVIKSALDTTDYMILIMAGRYGSMGSGGLSYTEREYDYALIQGIPVLAFLHATPTKLPADQYDTGELGEKRDAFWRKVRDSERHTVEFWTDARDLAQKVAPAIHAVIGTEPRPGWTRGGAEPAQEADRAAPVASGTPSPLSTSDDLMEALQEPGGVARLERVISNAAREVGSIPFVQGQGEFNAVADVQAEYAQRAATLEEAASPLVRSVAAAARWGSPALDRHWLDLITELSTPPRLGGSLVLVDLVRAPAVLVFTAAGLGACAGGRDDLLGLLLSDQLEVENPYRDEDSPAVAVLSAQLMYPDGWPSRRLREYFEKVLGADDAWQGSVFDRAWERWQYLVAVARMDYSARSKSSSGGWPYLRIEDGPGRTRRTTAGKFIRKQVKNAGDEHPLLSKGLCAGSAEVFETAAQTFDNQYGEWGENQDFAALPGMAGILPSGSHYPGDRTGM